MIAANVVLIVVTTIFLILVIKLVHRWTGYTPPQVIWDSSVIFLHCKDGLWSFEVKIALTGRKVLAEGNGYTTEREARLRAAHACVLRELTPIHVDVFVSSS